jgi:drug/metabolite transporter (DMT)-like permease
LCSALFLGEPMSAPQAVGGVLILGFTLLSDITIKRRPT